MSRIDQSAAAIVHEARAAYEAAKGGDGEEVAAAALGLAVEAFHLGQLLKLKGPMGKAARKRTTDAAPAESPGSGKRGARRG
jgi:hypothetical protein